MAGKRRLRKLLKPKRPRNPLVPVVCGLRPKAEPPATRYRRRPKHPRKLPED